MCGIVGFTGSHSANILASMSEAIRHRGPDGAGSFPDRETGVGLAARRLAIVDLPGGQQPFSDPSGRYQLVFNGEIYNAAELRAELARDGWPLKTSHSDTGCLLYLYIAHGPDMLQRLNGMFAFVVYDRVAGLLFGARDRIEQRSEAEWRERLGDELRQAVARWSRSDVLIACSLSGVSIRPASSVC